MENSRLLTFLLVSLAIVIFYNQLMQWRHPELAHRDGAQATLSPSPAISPSGTPPASVAKAPAAGPTASSGPSANAAAPAATIRTITIDTPSYRAQITALGGRIASFVLKDYRQTSLPGSPAYEIIAGGDRLPLAMVVSHGGAVTDDAEVVYHSDGPDHIDLTADTAAPATVTMTGVTADGIRLQKRFSFSRGYVFDVSGTADAPAGMKLDAIGLQLSRPLLANQGFHDIPELQADVQGKTLNEAQKALEKGVAPVSGKITFAGFGDRYFLAAFLPKKPVTGTLSMDYVDGEADARMLFDGTTAVETAVYMGPKELDALEAANPALNKAINFGWPSSIALPFLTLHNLFYRMAPNSGLAIIL